MSGWRRSLEVYSDRRVLLVLLLGFSSGLPLLLTFSTLSAWLATVGVRRAAIGAFALVGTPYAFKFVWSPLIDRLPPPLPLGRRRGWGISIQIALIAAIIALGACDPKHHLALMGAIALAVAFLSASQDIVIDAWRVEILPWRFRGPGAGMIQTGYRIAMLVSGAGHFADRFSRRVVCRLFDHGSNAGRGNSCFPLRARTKLGGEGGSLPPGLPLSAVPVAV